MNLRQHTTLAKRLIDAVGGVKNAEHVGRIRSTQLYMAMDPDSPYCLPADVIVVLEREAGIRIYSDAMHRAAPDGPGCSDLPGATLDLSADATELARAVHRALADQVLSPNERQDIDARLQPLIETINAIRAEVGQDPANGLAVVKG